MDAHMLEQRSCLESEKKEMSDAMVNCFWLASEAGSVETAPALARHYTWKWPLYAKVKLWSCCQCSPANKRNLLLIRGQSVDGIE